MSRAVLLGNYTYIPDIGEGTAVDTDPRAVGSAWHLPNDPSPQSSRQMVETLEMASEFEEAFVVDSTCITQLGVTATPIHEALEATLAAYRRD